MPAMQRRRSADEGRWGEDVAAAYLVRLGYGIAERNWRMGHYEIDIIARKGNVVAFVEVKTRATADADPVGAVDARKRARMVSLADAYLSRFPGSLEYRFDIVAVTGTEADYAVEHLPDAFVPALRNIKYSFRL